MAKSNIVNKLLGFFGITSQGSKENKTLVPAKETPKLKMKPIEFPSELQKAWKYWLNQVHDTGQSFKNRMDRYKDLDYMVYNDSVISMAAELYADEAVQADSQNEIITVNAKDKNIEKEINEFLETNNINQSTVREIAYNLAVYGDAFQINTIEDNKGIVEITNVDVRTIEERLEFNLINVKKQMQTTNSFFKSLASRNSRINDIMSNIDKTNSIDPSMYFKSYLFGYTLAGDLNVAPWSVNHYRLYTTKSEFAPYGRSLFINSISPFRQLKASKNLMSLARIAKFPKEVFKVKVHESMDPIEHWEVVNESKSEYHNLSADQRTKEEDAIGGEMWLAEGLIDYELIENGMNLDDIADIELLRDDMIIATRIPKGYLIVDRASFGTSGQALLQQHKPFARAVYTIQSAILNELSRMIKLHFLLQGKDHEEIDFELAMNFPNVEDSSDRIRIKQDTLGLARDIISNLGDALGLDRDEALPIDVVKDVFAKYTFIPEIDIEDWVKKYQDSHVEIKEDKKERIYKRLTENEQQLIKEVYFRCKKRSNLKEHVMQGKHLYLSSQTDTLYKDFFEIVKGEGKNVRKLTEKTKKK